MRIPTALYSENSQSLNQEDVFAIEATGGGKSALFGVPILIHLELYQNPSLYPTFMVPISMHSQIL